MFLPISTRLSETEHVRESARKIEEHADLFSQFGAVLKTRSRVMEYSDCYAMAAVAFYEVGDYESAARCFSKACITLMFFLDDSILKKWADHNVFMYHFALHKQGLLCELPAGVFDREKMTSFLGVFNDFKALPNDLKHAYSL